MIDSSRFLLPKINESINTNTMLTADWPSILLVSHHSSVWPLTDLQGGNHWFKGTVTMKPTSSDSLFDLTVFKLPSSCFMLNHLHEHYFDFLPLPPSAIFPPSPLPATTSPRGLLPITPSSTPTTQKLLQSGRYSRTCKYNKHLEHPVMAGSQLLIHLFSISLCFLSNKWFFHWFLYLFPQYGSSFVPGKVVVEKWVKTYEW